MTWRRRARWDGVSAFQGLRVSITPEERGTLMCCTSFIKSCAIFLLALCAGSAAPARNITVARFDDPSPGGDPSLFTLHGDTFSGGWTGDGLLLETPDLAAPDFPNAHFT